MKKTLRDRLGSVDFADDEDESSATEGGRGKRQRSGLLSSPSEAPGGSRSLEVKGTDIPLPQSGGTAYCAYAELSPDQCFVSELNPRMDEFLSLDDPLLSDIYRSIESMGQRDPVLAREVTVDGEIRYEIIYGKTRHYILTQLAEKYGEDGGYKLKAWVGNIPDADVRPLAIGENKDRRDLSAYERGCDMLRLQTKGAYRGKTREEIGAIEGLSERSVGRHLDLARLPKAFVRMMVSPQGLGADPGADAYRYWQHAEKHGVQEFDALDQLSKKEPFKDGKQLVKALKTIAESAPKKKAEKGAGRPTTLFATRKLKDAEGQERVVVTQNRGDKKRFKVDLKGITHEEAAEVSDWLEKYFKLKS